MTPEFIHLHVHTAYSLLEGAIKVKNLLKLCEKYKMPAIAATDTENLFGGMDLSYSAFGSGIQPILGTQLFVRTNAKATNQMTAREEMKMPLDKIVLLVQNEVGYQNILKIFDIYYMGEGKQDTPHITWDELYPFSEGLILLTGGAEGPLGHLVLDGKKNEAVELLTQIKTHFGDRVYIELQRHGLAYEEQAEPDLLDLAYSLNVPLVATNDVMFAEPSMYEAHDALICIAEKTYVDQEDRKRLTPEHYFKSPEQMKELFKDLPEAISNTVVIAKRCAFMLKKKPAGFPRYDCGDLTEDELLRKKAEDGLKMRMENRSDEYDKYHERLQYELGIICQMGFPGYFLIVSDFIQWSKKQGIPVGPGRGSGAGSVVAWALTITDIDPLRFNLLFERFLNPERVSMPDFDVDFCQERRGESIHYVQEKYGFDHVAQIITFGQLQTKAVMRDVGRVLQVPYPVVDRLCKLVPSGNDEDGHPYTLKRVLEIEPAFQSERDKEPQVDKLINIALQLEGLYRNTSTHAAGVVIGREALNEIVPIYKDPSSDMPVTQYNMKFIEDTGLIKFDFLGLKTLTVLAKTVELLKQRNIDVNLSNIPLEDKATFDLLSEAKTVGVFQLESTGMRKILKDMAPDKIEDIVAIVALYRPGPMGNIPSYIERKHGREKPDYLLPMLEGILKETYGIMIYQEQVMQIAQVLAGYSLGGADLLRRAMGKKKVEEMVKQRAIFVEGARKNGVTEEKATEIFDLMEKFANYGFNKSHAAAYAFVSYQTAYLKAHYPVEFMAATMTLDKIDTDKLGMFKRDVNELGIDILPPDINKSGVNFTVENGAIRYALSAIKNVGEGAMQALVEERVKNGPYKSIADFVMRSDPSVINKRCFENLVKSGAFDSLEKNRGRLFFNIEKLAQHSARIQTEKNSSQISLFGEQSSQDAIQLTDAPDWPMLEKLEKEAEAIGFYLSAHPLDTYEKSLERLRVTTSKEVEAMVRTAGAVHLKMVGIVNTFKERVGQYGRYAFVSASDTAGAFEIRCFEEALATSRTLLSSNEPLLFSVLADLKDDEVRLTLQNTKSLNEAVAGATNMVQIFYDNEKCLPKIHSILAGEPSGRGQVVLIPTAGDWQVEIVLPERYKLTPAALEAFRTIPEINEVKLV